MMLEDDSTALHVTGVVGDEGLDSPEIEWKWID